MKRRRLLDHGLGLLGAGLLVGETAARVGLLAFGFLAWRAAGAVGRLGWPEVLLAIGVVAVAVATYAAVLLVGLP